MLILVGWTLADHGHALTMPDISRTGAVTPIAETPGVANMLALLKHDCQVLQSTVEESLILTVHCDARPATGVPFVASAWTVLECGLSMNEPDVQHN